jgi:hypothetical protein
MVYQRLRKLEEEQGKAVARIASDILFKVLIG